MKKSIRGRRLTMLLTAAALLSALGVTAAAVYRDLCAEQTLVQDAFDEVGTRLSARTTLVAQLVQQAGAHTEAARLAREACQQLEKAQDMQQIIEGDEDCTRAMAMLLLAGQNDPVLSQDADFTALVQSIIESESLLAQARKQYNGAAMAFNRRLRRFPFGLIASVSGLEPYNAFTAATTWHGTVG